MEKKEGEERKGRGGMDGRRERRGNVLFLLISFILGCRVASLLVNLVPSVDTFKAALRGIKKWAKSTSRKPLLNIFSSGLRFNRFFHRASFRPSFFSSGFVPTDFFIR
jgi:poly(A) polymerase Pap1